MYIKDYLKQFGDKKINIYVDMDGVVAHYEVGKPRNYDEKRPLNSSIKKLKTISKMKNVNMYILSVTRMNQGIIEKNEWLDKYMPFIDKQNRFILSREANDFRISKDLKTSYLKTQIKDDSITIFIDDDPRIINDIRENLPSVYLLKDTALVD